MAIKLKLKLKLRLRLIICKDSVQRGRSVGPSVKSVGAGQSVIWAKLHGPRGGVETE